MRVNIHWFNISNIHIHFKNFQALMINATTAEGGFASGRPMKWYHIERSEVIVYKTSNQKNILLGLVRWL